MTLPSLDSVVQDLRAARRSLARRPFETAVSLLLFAGGIGLNIALLTVVQATLLQELPVENPQRTVVVTGTFDGHPAPFSLPEAKAHAERNELIEAIGVFTRGESIGWSHDGRAEGVRLGFADSTLFAVLGVPMKLGRAFEASEDQPLGVHPVAVVSSGFWARAFGQTSTLGNETLGLAGKRYRVVGVTPPDFPLDGVDVWLPFSMSDRYFGPEVLDSFWSWQAFGVGRLTPDATLEAAADRARGVFDEIESLHPWAMMDRGVRLVSLRQHLFGRLDEPLRVLVFGALFVLMICAVNVGALHLVRSVGRTSEVRLRLALGASPAQIARQLVVESTVLGLLGGCLGILVAASSVGALVRMADLGTPSWSVTELRPEIAAVGVVLSLLTGAAVGALPALRLGRTDSGALVRGTKRQAGGRRVAHQQRAIIVLETSVAVALLVLAGVGARSLYLLTTASVGFRTEHLTTMRLNIKLPGYNTILEDGGGWMEDADYEAALVRRARLLEQIVQEVESLPGAGTATFWGPDMLGSSSSQISMVADTRDPQDPSESAMGQYLTVGPGGLTTLGLPLLQGREFTAEDRLGSLPVVVLSRRVAETYWPDGEALGRHLLTWSHFDEETNQQVYDHWRIVGIVADAAHRGRTYRQGLGGDYFAGDVYFPILQQAPSQPTLLVRGQSSVELAPAIERAVQRLNPDIAVYDVRTFEQRLREEEHVPRFAVALMGFYASVAGALAFIGIYGVLAFAVRLRRREMAIRRALGASASTIRRLVLLESLSPISVGIFLGLCAAGVVVRLFASQVLNVEQGVLGVVGLVTLLALAAGALATLPAAVRSARTPPAVALRGE